MPSKQGSATLSVAPMMGHSHGAARHLWHMLCPGAMLCTEMVPAAALVNNGGDRRYLYGARQGHVALQVAGDDPRVLAQAAKIGNGLGYAEINLNCGCPSKRATAGNFGASMMQDPVRTAGCVAAMVEASDVPVSVKCRIAVDGLDPAECLFGFAARMQDAGCKKLVVHARRALLKGVNPKQNRTRPPLDPQLVVELKEHFPGMEIISNGGIDSVEAATGRAVGVDGVMLGRTVVARPAILAEFAEKWFGRKKANLAEIAGNYIEHAMTRLVAGDSPRLLLAPLARLACCRPGARAFRQRLHQAAASGDMGTVMAAWP